MGSNDTEKKEIQFSVSNSDYDSSDDRWLDQVNTLVQDLQRDVGQVRREITPIPGMKGGLETFFLELFSSGIVPAAIDTIKSWLEIDKSRVFEISSIGPDGEEKKISISGMDLDKEEKLLYLKAIFG
jgi:hypothetical protein